MGWCSLMTQWRLLMVPPSHRVAEGVARPREDARVGTAPAGGRQGGTRWGGLSSLRVTPQDTRQCDLTRHVIVFLIGVRDVRLGSQHQSSRPALILSAFTACDDRQDAKISTSLRDYDKSERSGSQSHCILTGKPKLFIEKPLKP